MTLWTEKYRPKVIEDLLISKDNLSKLHIWIKGFIKKNDLSISNCLFLYGPPGCGKTSLAYILLNKYKYDIIELNASELRKQKDMTEKFNDILQKRNILSMFNNTTKENAIIMDEIDGLTSGERGTLTDLIKIMFPKKNLMKKNPSYYRYKNFNPFICITNSLDKKITEIKNKSIVLTMNYPTHLQLEKLSKKILIKEKKDFNDTIIKEIVKHSQRDIRRLITILDFIFNANNFKFDYKTCKDLLDKYEKKNVDNTNYEAANNILSNYLGIDEIYFNYSNKNIISIIIYENFISRILAKKNNASSLSIYNDILHIYKNFSIGDVIDLNIYKNQNWCLNNYYCFYTCIEPSFIINNMKSSFKTNSSLNFSTLLNKTSLEYLNIKFINTILVLFKYSNSITICDIAELFEVYSDHLEITTNYIDITKLSKFIK
jgi:replication factor C subunit 1